MNFPGKRVSVNNNFPPDRTVNEAVSKAGFYPQTPHGGLFEVTVNQ